MKTTMKLFTYGLMILSLVFTSCTNDDEAGPIGPAVAQGTAGIDGADATNAADEVAIKDHNLNEIQGASSTIDRSENGITVNFKTDGLIPGNAYTLWFVVFGEAGPPSSTHAAGLIVSESGKGNISGHLNAGDIFDNPDLMKFFYNPLTAEVHIALRSHGPAQPGMMPSQIQTIDGGCLTGFPTGPVLHPDSDIVGYCANTQVAIHPSVN